MKKIIYVLFLFLTYSFATTCSDYNTLAGYGVIGGTGFTYGNNSIINNNTITGTNGTTPTPTGTVTTVHPTFPPFSPATFPATGTINLTNQAAVTPGSYGTIQIDQNNLTTAFSAGNYYIKELILSKNNATAQLAPGDYYIEKLTMDNNTFITVSPSGPVRIFIMTSFQGGNEIGINANGNVQNMIIYLYSGVEMQIGNGNNGTQQTLTFSGTIYSPFSNTTIQMGNNNNVQGAILSAGSVTVGNNTTFDYSATVQNAVIDSLGCSVPPVTYCTSFQYELYHPLSSAHKLQTRIAQQSFDLNVTATCIDAGLFPNKKITNVYAINAADACAITSPNLQLWSSVSGADINDSVRTITLNSLNSTKAFSNIRLMLKTSSGEYYCSTDSMAVRPSSFTITSPGSSIKASAFDLSVGAINSGGGYNGTANVSTALQASNANCPISSGFITSNTGTSLIFINDANTTKMKATDAGAIYLNVKDFNWTTIDQASDCLSNSSTTSQNLQGLVGCNIETNLSITIIPDHFDINATLSNINGGAFTYLSTDLAMSSSIDINITAKNSDGNVTKNYTSGCFAKTISLSLPHSTVPSPLSKILYHDNLNALDANISSSNPISLSFSESKFTQGSALPKVTFNFDRNSSKPLNPFDFNLTSADVNNTDSVIGTTLPTGKTTFLFGRARAYDIKTDQSTAPNPIELEIYSRTPTSYVSGMPQNVLYWYRNMNHSLLSQGSILNGDDYTSTTKTGTSSTITINSSTAPSNGQHLILINNPDAISHALIHLAIPSWLWYSTLNNYDFNSGTTCLQHPCFDYQFFGTSSGNFNGVNSGTFQGSDFDLSPAKTIIKKGVKVFR